MNSSGINTESCISIMKPPRPSGKKYSLRSRHICAKCERIRCEVGMRFRRSAFPAKVQIRPPPIHPLSLWGIPLCSEGVLFPSDRRSQTHFGKMDSRKDFGATSGIRFRSEGRIFHSGKNPGKNRIYIFFNFVLSSPTLLPSEGANPTPIHPTSLRGC